MASGVDARMGGAGDTAPNPALTASLAAKAGLVAAAAVLIRPNLAPLAVVPCAALALVRVPTRAHSAPPAPSRARATAPVSAALIFAWPVACAGAFLAGLQWYWYGSPLTSGYGTAGQLFTLASVGPNAGRYAGWLLDAAPLLAAAPLGLLALHRLPMARWTVLFAALNVIAYLVYAEFDSWPYLRFMLPGLALGAVWLGAGVAAIVARMPLPARAPVLFCLLLVAALLGATGARDRMAFDLAAQQHRLPIVGHGVRARTPSTAVIIASEQSGSMRYYANRAILRWDDATVDEMRAALAALAGAEREVWVVIDMWEEPLFRQKFGALPTGGLDWPPAIDAGTTHRTRAWRLSDRDRHVRGASVETERLR